MNAQLTNKSDLRRQITARRPDFQTLEKMSAAVLKKYQSLDVLKTAKAVGAYMPLPDEVDVRPLLEQRDKRLYIPAFDEAAGGYRMAKYTAELKKGKFGIPEPAHPLWAGPDEFDLILVPGVAFDRHGNRLGRGGGFYDRLLPQYNALRAGICFDFQILEAVTAELHDCKMDWLVTESGILKTAMNS